jgi:hypothetical protein
MPAACCEQQRRQLQHDHPHHHDHGQHGEHDGKIKHDNADGNVNTSSKSFSGSSGTKGAGTQTERHLEFPSASRQRALPPGQ